MAFYYSFRNEPPDAQRRTAEGLLKLRAQLEREVPRGSIADTLLVATWNLREFDSEKYGFRTCESLHYIAEIVSHLDIVAIHGVRADLSALDEAAYVEAMGEHYAAKPDAVKKSRYYKDWRTFQMSDHLLLWCELWIDFSTAHLERVTQATRRRHRPTTTARQTRPRRRS